jgi:anti-sigma regulatory factor (Ser/Thr protein kinase)
MEPVLEQRIPAVPASITVLRHDAVDAFEKGGGNPALSGDVALAVTEACANAIRHAYPNRSDGHLTLRAWFEDSLFVVQVLDRGVGIDAPSQNPGARLGVALLEQLADAQFALREGGGTETRLAFALSGREQRPTAALEPSVWAAPVLSA